MDDDGGGMEMGRRKKWGGQARNLKEREREPLSLYIELFFFLFLSVVFGGRVDRPTPSTPGSRPPPQEECLWENAAPVAYGTQGLNVKKKY
jgi:hypothetical protein